MKISIVTILLIGLTLSGCAPMKKSSVPEIESTLPQPSEPEALLIAQSAGSPDETFPKAEPRPSLQNISEEMQEEAIPAQGIVFAKTDFQGVLQATYVKLEIVEVKDEQQSYQLIIGDKSQQSPLPWSGQTVQPGYFFIQLPAGEYRIPSISIPVGATMATEEMHIRFTVQPEKVVYLGTLKVIGTKERIKLGGVPVIKPGFEYTVEVIGEQVEAIRIFHKRYPNIPLKVGVDLMEIHDQGGPESSFAEDPIPSLQEDHVNPPEEVQREEIP